MGYMGKILRVNLTDGEIKTEDLDLNVARQFVGGSGLGAKILYDEVDPLVDALSPENKIIFATGPLTGTEAPCSGRYATVFKSPETGGYGDGHAGGRWPAELKFAGYDAVIVEGLSEKPVYLFIHDGRAELRDAKHIWGQNVLEMTGALKNELGDSKTKILGIGRAGEKLVKFACVVNDEARAGGRGGAGAVMGYKKLKAIAVRGSGRPAPADAEGFKKAAKAAAAALSEFPAIAGMTDQGTAVFIDPLNGFGLLPTKNFQTGVFEEYKKINGTTLKDKYLKKRTACYRCPIACGRNTKIEEGPYKGLEGEGPEYEAIGGFGSLCDNSDLASIIKSSSLCNEYGIDIISCANAIAFAMECYEKGLITTSDTYGLRPVWGDSDVIVSLVEMIGERKGLGDTLAEGIKRVSERIGDEAVKIAQHVKGLETPMHEPRGMKGMGLAYATSNRGACHIRPYMGTHEIFGEAHPEMGLPEGVDRFTEEGKAGQTKIWQEQANFINALDICQFVCVHPCVQMSDLVELFNTATGFGFSPEDGFRAGERIHNIQRLFNVRAGFKRDKLPPRFLTESLADGPSSGHVVHLDIMLDEYYDLRDWDREGVPSRQKLEALGLA